MSPNHLSRPFTPDERRQLEQLLTDSPSAAKRFNTGLENALVAWAVSMLVIMVVWLCVVWLARRAMAWEIGWHSPYALWMVLILLASTAAWAIVSSVRWMKGWKDYRPELKADLDGGQVMEERYRFTAAKRFQEPEHGGLLYCFHTDDDRVFVLYDSESQDLGAADGNPLESSFQASSELCLVRALRTGFVLITQFSGTPLEVGVPSELNLPPKNWPQPETYCDIPWGELETRLSAA